MQMHQALNVQPQLVQDLAVMICQTKNQNPYEVTVYYGPIMPGTPQSVMNWQLYVEDVMEYLHLRRIFEPFLQSHGIPL